jgi:UDP-N-acetylglucosamine 1-carboxyvinyltransferase
MSSIRYVVEGGRPLAGSLNQRATRTPFFHYRGSTADPRSGDLQNVPRIRDTGDVGRVVRSVGASADWTGDNTPRSRPGKFAPKSSDPVLCANIRASILLAGPVLALRTSDSFPARW